MAENVGKRPDKGAYMVEGSHLSPKYLHEDPCQKVFAAITCVRSQIVDA